ncbi:hypothetical protein AKJ41_01245, partial [candidate division MSBL1 archaeon SCGC-AAA259O05]
LYDSRSGVINIWCSPRDKPEGYGYEIRRGALNHPRDYVATIVPRRGDSGSSTVDLELQVDPERGGTEPLEHRAEPTAGERRWAKEKLDELIEMGEEEGVFEEVLICPLCGGEVGANTFNGFVEHIATHVEVDSVKMEVKGKVLHLAGGRTLFPSDYIQKRARK